MAVPSRTDIPVGRNNAVTRMALSGRWNMPDRKVRRQIARFREDDSDGMIVVSSSRGRGYYRTSDPDEIRAFIGDTAARIRSLSRLLICARRALKRANGQMEMEIGEVRICQTESSKTASAPTSRSTV